MTRCLKICGLWMSLAVFACLAQEPAEGNAPGNSTAASPLPAVADRAVADRAGAESKARGSLEAVRKSQAELTAAQEAGIGAQAGAQRDIHAADLELAAASRQAHDILQRIAALELERSVLEQRKSALSRQLDKQRAVVGALLRSAHALGRHRQLKIMLDAGHAGPDARVARLLAYHRALELDRSARLRRIAEDLSALDKVQRAIASNRVHWQTASLKQALAVAARTRARGARAQVLAKLESAQGARGARLLALRSDEKGLIALLVELTNAIADVPTLLDEAQPISGLRGKLPWPVRGRILRGFGASNDAGDPQGGVVIAAKSGAEIASVAHGRVVYADWLRGYGLVLIVDHGDGFITLYAHNEALLRNVGDWVARGEALSTAGLSGGRSDPGVYFELRRDGKPQNPVAWLER